MDLKLIYSKKRPEDLWLDLKTGDRKAFSLLYELHVKQLFTYAIRFCQDQGLVEDTIQELFSDLWLRRDKIENVHSVKGYLFASLRRRLIRKLRQKNIIYNSGLLNFSHSFEISIESQLLLQQDEEEIRKKLQEVIASLPGLQRELIYLRFYTGLNLDEICNLLDINKKSAYNAMAKAIQKFRALLELALLLLLI